MSENVCVGNVSMIFSLHFSVDQGFVFGRKGDVLVVERTMLSSMGRQQGGQGL